MDHKRTGDFGEAAEFELLIGFSHCCFVDEIIQDIHTRQVADNKPIKVFEVEI